MNKILLLIIVLSFALYHYFLDKKSVNDPLNNVSTQMFNKSSIIEQSISGLSDPATEDLNSKNINDLELYINSLPNSTKLEIKEYETKMANLKKSARALYNSLSDKAKEVIRRKIILKYE